MLHYLTFYATEALSNLELLVWLIKVLFCSLILYHANKHVLKISLEQAVNFPHLIKACIFKYRTLPLRQSKAPMTSGKHLFHNRPMQVV